MIRGLAVLAACAVAIDNACSIDDGCDDDAVLIDDVRACELGGQSRARNPRLTIDLAVLWRLAWRASPR